MVGCLGWDGRAGALRAVPGRSHTVSPLSALSQSFLSGTSLLCRRHLPPCSQLPSHERFPLRTPSSHSSVLSGMEGLSLSLRPGFSWVQAPGWSLQPDLSTGRQWRNMCCQVHLCQH